MFEETHKLFLEGHHIVGSGRQKRVSRVEWLRLIERRYIRGNDDIGLFPDGLHIGILQYLGG